MCARVPCTSCSAVYVVQNDMSDTIFGTDEPVESEDLASPSTTLEECGLKLWILQGDKEETGQRFYVRAASGLARKKYPDLSTLRGGIFQQLVDKETHILLLVDERSWLCAKVVCQMMRSSIKNPPDTNVQGFASCKIETIETNLKILILYEMHLDEMQCGKGIESSLCDEVRKFARTEGCAGIMIRAHESNQNVRVLCVAEGLEELKHSIQSTTLTDGFKMFHELWTQEAKSKFCGETHELGDRSPGSDEAPFSDKEDDKDSEVADAEDDEETDSEAADTYELCENDHCFRLVTLRNGCRSQFCKQCLNGVPPESPEAITHESDDDGSESQGAASSGPPGFLCALGCGMRLPFGYHSQDCGACSRTAFWSGLPPIASEDECSDTEDDFSVIDGGDDDATEVCSPDKKRPADDDEGDRDALRQKSD